MRIMKQIILCSLVLVLCSEVNAQVKEVSIPFLKAAIGSIDNRGRVRVRGKYDAVEGLTETTGRYLRNKGYSRFSVTDLEGRTRFVSFYCHQDSRAFRSLLDTTETTYFIFYGYKERGERGEDAIIVTEVTRIPEPEKSEPDDSGVSSPDPQAEKKTYRITMMDVATSNKTVLVNVELGKPCNLFGTVLVVEEEEPRLQGVILPGENQ